MLGAYLALYPAFRIGVEYWRDDRARTLLIGDLLSTTQAASAALAAVGLWLVWSAARRR